mmetsp:Transcript_12690/g.46398  ORF Transcript_12690/g.46398 Transcript_12690/m.46398 type:complete len:200 (+) Transcript_12690:722-1321(+)|eukprot:scaffold523_cov446-Prasinococcus_capsulatus_cf.AAC.19
MEVESIKFLPYIVQTLGNVGIQARQLTAEEQQQQQEQQQAQAASPTAAAAAHATAAEGEDAAETEASDEGDGGALAAEEGPPKKAKRAAKAKQGEPTKEKKTKAKSKSKAKTGPGDSDHSAHKMHTAEPLQVPAYEDNAAAAAELAGFVPTAGGATTHRSGDDLGDEFEFDTSKSNKRPLGVFKQQLALRKQARRRSKH